MVHGQSGLEGIAISPPTVPLYDGHATALLRKIIFGNPRPVTIIATGPLTNIAYLIDECREVVHRIREIVFMGGSTERGNVTPYGEFNVVADPEAASQVLASGIPITFCGLNVTYQILVSPKIVHRIRNIGSQLSSTCVDLLTFFTQMYYEIFGMSEPPLHDPVAVARVIDLSIVQCVSAPVAVERPVDTHDDWDEWKALFAEAGITRDVGVHGVRHTCGTLLGEQHVDMHVIQRILGHAQVSTTRIYTDPTDPLTREAVDRIGRMLWPDAARRGRNATTTAAGNIGRGLSDGRITGPEPVGRQGVEP